jgi:membrane fusion protein, multidrug efflux system
MAETNRQSTWNYLCMSNPDPISAAAPRAVARPGPSSRIVTRILVTGTVGLLTVAAVAIGIRWGCYRYHHVVLREATVKGRVTKIGARIENRIKSVEVEVGQRVAQGEILLRMEDSHLQAALERARAELQSATRDFESDKMGVEQTRRRLSLEIDRANGVRKKTSGELEAAKGSLTSLQKQYERVATLLKSGAAASSEMDRIMGDRDRAQGLVNARSGELEAVEFGYQKAMNELEGVHVREARLGVLEAQVAVARAKVAAAEADVEATVIKAPENGRVLERLVEVGGSVKVGEPMISLWLGRAWVEAWADERELHKFGSGSHADITLDIAPRRKLSGRVESIGLESDKHLQLAPVPATLHAFLRVNAMVPIRIAFEEDNSRIQLGLSALVGIDKESETPETERPHVAGASPHLGAEERLNQANGK